MSFTIHTNLSRFKRVLAGVIALSLTMGDSTCLAGTPLRAQFFGVSTVLVSDGEHALMTDGFFSRPGYLGLLLGVSPNESRINRALELGKVKKLDALLVAHSHHDHAMDAGVVAMKTGAVVVGTRSVSKIAIGSGLPAERIKVVQGGEVIEAGNFRIHVVVSPHSTGTIFPGEIAEPLITPAWLSKYKEGGNFSYLIEHPSGRVLVHASANFRAGMYKGRKADVVFLGVGLLGKQPDDFIKNYWREVVLATGAKLVIPIHWDDFTRSLDHPLEPTSPLFDKVNRALTTLAALGAADGIEVRVLQPFQSVGVLAKH